MTTMTVQNRARPRDVNVYGSSSAPPKLALAESPERLLNTQIWRARWGRRDRCFGLGEEESPFLLRELYK